MREGVFIHMYSGVSFYPFNPKPNQILLEDIARNLANTSRYNGGTRRYYSTAQHSVIMSYIAEDDYGLEVARAALLHDAGEAYCGEIVKPIKDEMQPFTDIENIITRAVFTKYGIDPDLWSCKEIAALDLLMVAIEYRDLRPQCPPFKGLPTPPEEIIIDPIGPRPAYDAFLHRFGTLFPEYTEHVDALIETGM